MRFCITITIALSSALLVGCIHPMTVYVRTADSKPISGAIFNYKTSNYKTEYKQHSGSTTSDSEGRILLHPKLGDVIDGWLASPPRYGQVELFVRAPRNILDGWVFVRGWTVSFGINTLKSTSYFVSDFDNSSEHSLDIYLPRSDHAEVLPYGDLCNLAGRLREAQRTGRMFNSELNVQNLESYRQLAEVAQVYDPHSPDQVRFYAYNIFRYLSLQHDDLESVLKKLLNPNLDSTIRDNGLAQMLFILQIHSSGSASWQERSNLIQKRLDFDLATIRNVPKPK